MARPIYLAQLLAMLLASPICLAQTLIDDYGFYRSWKELNDRYFANQVELDERGLEPGTDTRINKLSDRGLYRVSVKPETALDSETGSPAPPFNQIHSWLVKVEPVDVKATYRPELEFYGGMPLHNHGFPTSPTISAGSEQGVYRLDGIKFSMLGWWQFAIAIKTAENIDTVRFNLLIEP